LQKLIKSHRQMKKSRLRSLLHLVQFVYRQNAEYCHVFSVVTTAEESNTI
jgi:hypothetical protein